MKTEARMTNVRVSFMAALLIVLCASKAYAQCAGVLKGNGPDGNGNVHAWTILTDNYTNPGSNCAPQSWGSTSFTHTYSGSVTVTSPSGRQARGYGGGSQSGGGGTSTVRADISLPFDGESGIFAISGLDTILCSFAGPFYSWADFGSFSVPPVINGINDNSTGSTTIYQGATGYLAIYGTALTAWGETPTPTVTGDSGLTLGTYWASDTQVDASYTVDAQAPVGQHTVTLQTAAGQAQGTIQVAAPAISLTRNSLTAVTATGTPEGGTFLWGGDAAFASGVTSTANPNSATLYNPPNPSPTGAPTAGSLEPVSGWYSVGNSNLVSSTFHIPIFGMSCYYTTSQQQWGTAPDSCINTTINGTTYTGSVANPPGLPVGSYCNSFLAQLRLQGSAVLVNGTDVQYNPGTGYYVTNSITAADGSPAVGGQTIARDRSIIPRNPITYVDINGIGSGLLANDTGGAIVGYRIDFYGGAGSGVCSGYSNTMAVSGCSPSNATCPGDTTIQ